MPMNGRLWDSGLGKDSVLRQIANNELGPSKHFKRSSSLGLLRTPVGLNAARHNQPSGQFAGPKVLDSSVKQLGISLVNTESWFSSSRIKYLSASFTVNLAANRVNLLRAQPTYTALDAFSKSVGAKLAPNYSASMYAQFNIGISALVSGLATPILKPESLEAFRFNFLDSIDPQEIHERVEQLESDPELVEDLTTVGTTDPFHQELLETAGRWA